MDALLSRTPHRVTAGALAFVSIVEAALIIVGCIGNCGIESGIGTAIILCLFTLGTPLLAAAILGGAMGFVAPRHARVFGVAAIVLLAVIVADWQLPHAACASINV